MKPSAVSRVLLIPDPPGAYYQRASLCVKTLASRHPIDCFNLKHIDEYYKILYSNGEGDKKKLKKALEDRDYQRVQEAYKMIESRGIQVIVPWKDKMDLFHSLEEEYKKTGLTQELIRRARAKSPQISMVALGFLLILHLPFLRTSRQKPP